MDWQCCRLLLQLQCLPSFLAQNPMIVVLSILSLSSIVVSLELKLKSQPEPLLLLPLCNTFIKSVAIVLGQPKEQLGIARTELVWAGWWGRWAASPNNEQFQFTEIISIHLPFSGTESDAVILSFAILFTANYATF